jgi:uncharacterized protein YndB with AHSA1/START domain
VTAEAVIRVERHVRAVPRTVYRYLTESAAWARWQGESAEIEPVVGGRFRMRMGNGLVAEGRFVELVADARVVFTWGWTGDPTVPPGSTTVEIELVPHEDGTVIRLSHRGLPPASRRIHQAGWEHYLGRLATVSAGLDPGLDPGPPPA